MSKTEWKEYKLGEIYEVHNGLSKGREFFGSGYPFISFSTVFNKWFIPEIITDFAQTTESEQESYSIKAGDILVTRTSETADELGMSCVALRDIPNATYNGFCKRMRQYNKDVDVDSKYVGYYMRNPEFRKKFQAFAGSMSTRASLTNDALLGLTIKLPPLAEQQRIAKILSSLDDKIKLNNAINRNLEEQCNIFFEHFIQSHENKLYPLSELILKANTGADAIQRAPIVEYNTGVRCIRVGDLSNKRPFYEWGYAKVSNEDFKRYRLRKGDIVVSRTASLGLNCMISSDLSAVYNNGLIRLSIDTNRALPSIVYRQFQTFDYRNYISRISAETSVRPNMKIDYLLNYSFKIPDLSKQKELAALIEPFFDQQNHIAIENQHLSSLRDYLLPKLMIGEIDAEKISI